jgi:hypothetical protein
MHALSHSCTFVQFAASGHAHDANFEADQKDGSSTWKAPAVHHTEASRKDSSHVADKNRIGAEDDTRYEGYEGYADDLLRDDGGQEDSDSDSDFGIMGSHMLYVKVWRPLRGEDLVCRSESCLCLCYVRNSKLYNGKRHVRSQKMDEIEVDNLSHMRAPDVVPA